MQSHEPQAGRIAAGRIEAGVGLGSGKPRPSNPWVHTGQLARNQRKPEKPEKPVNVLRPAEEGEEQEEAFRRTGERYGSKAKRECSKDNMGWGAYSVSVSRGDEGTYGGVRLRGTAQRGGTAERGQPGSRCAGEQRGRRENRVARGGGGE